MGGKSKSQTTGYKYYMGLLMGLCHGPIDALLEIRAGDRTAWKGEQDTSGAIPVNAPKLFGGDEKEGGVVGMLDVQMGEPTQLENDYLISKLGSGRGAYRGIVSLVFRAVLAAERSLFGSDSAKILSGMLAGGGGHITSNNPYIKPWAFRVRRILQGWKGGTAWYAAKAQIELGCSAPVGTAGKVWRVMCDPSQTPYDGEYNFTNYTLTGTTGLISGGLGGFSYVIGNYWYFFQGASTNLYYASPAKNVPLTAITGTLPLRGSMASDGTYAYLHSGSGTGRVQRLTLPTGPVTTPDASTNARSNGVCVHKSNVYSIGTANGEMRKSTDQGVSYSLIGSLAGTGSNPYIESNGTNLVVVQTRGAPVIEFFCSSDDGSTWDGPFDPFSGTGGTDLPMQPLHWDGTHFIVVTRNGKTAYSTTGLNGSWVVGGTIPKTVVKLSIGIGKILAGTAEVNLYETTNHGATWTEVASPEVSTNGTHYAYPYWIGGDLGAPAGPSTCFKSMNPAHIVYECLTNAEWGMGYDVSIIDSASFTAAADVFYAEGLGLCLQWLRQDSIENFIKLVMDHAGAVTVEDRTTGLIQLKPLRGGYTIGSLPQFGSELGNVIELRRFERAAITDNINEVSVSYTDAQTGKTGSVAVQNLAAVQASGRVISQSVDYPGLPTMDLAVRTALRDLKAYTSSLARVHLTVNRAGYALTPGDVIAFSWLPDGISLMPLRVIDVDYGSLTDGQVQLECLEDVFGLPATTYVAQQETGWVTPDSTAQPPAATAVFEAPYRELLAAIGRSETQALSVEAGYVYAVAARAPGFNLCYELYTKIGADPYADTGTGDWCPSGTLVAAISASATSITLAAFDDLASVAVGSLAMLGAGATAEMVRVVTVDADTGVLTIARGCLDTTPKAWALGTRFWAIDDASCGSTTEYATTEVVDAKILTRTSTDLLALGSVSATTVTMNQRQIRPYPPGLLRIKDDLNTVTGLAYPLELAGALTASWAHRDRVLQDDQIIDETAASIGPEAGTTYTVRYYQPPGTLVNTQSAISGTSATAYTFPADGPAEIRVEASRSGYTSWQSAQHIFDYYRYPRIIDTAEGRVTDDGSVRKVI